MPFTKNGEAHWRSQAVYQKPKDRLRRSTSIPLIAHVQFQTPFACPAALLLALGSDPGRRCLSARNGAIKTHFAERVQR